MMPHCFDMPDDSRELAAWLESHLVGDTLGELIAELSAAHPADEDRSQMLADVLGNEMAVVPERGLVPLTEQRLRSLIRWPWLLRELQQRVLTDGGPYWQTLAASRSFDAERDRVWRRMEIEIKNEAPASGRPSGPRLPSEEMRLSSAELSGALRHPARHTQIGHHTRMLIAVAALILLGVGLWRAMPRSEPWGWYRPGVFAQDVPAAAYLRRLADSAEEYFARPRDTTKQLEQTITDFRRSCDVLLAAQHETLNDTDRAWLRERCQAWSKKFDDQLAELRRTGDTATVRVAADETIRKLITALRSRHGEPRGVSPRTTRNNNRRHRDQSTSSGA